MLFHGQEKGDICYFDNVNINNNITINYNTNNFIQAKVAIVNELLIG